MACAFFLWTCRPNSTRGVGVTRPVLSERQRRLIGAAHYWKEDGRFLGSPTSNQVLPGGHQDPRVGTCKIDCLYLDRVWWGRPLLPTTTGPMYLGIYICKYVWSHYGPQKPMRLCVVPMMIGVHPVVPVYYVCYVCMGVPPSVCV